MNQDDQKCKIVIVQGKKEESFCIVGTPIIEGNAHYRLPNTDIVIDGISKNLFLDPDYTAFIAVQKKIDRKVFTVSKLKIYVLHPLNNISEKKPEIVKYISPSIKSSGSYGKIKVHPSSKIAVKSSSRLAIFNDIPFDIVREISMYKLFSKGMCLPKLYHFDSRRMRLQLELGAGTLNNILKKLTYENTVHIMYRLLSCFRSIWAQGIIHCDIKPENLIISQTGNIQIIDWGVSENDKSLGQTRIKKSSGTVPYQSIENLVKKDTSSYSYKTDVFSLGLVFIKMFVKKPIGAELRIPQMFFLMQELLDKSYDEYSVNKLLEGDSVSDIIYKNLRSANIFLNKGESVPEMPEQMADLISHMLEFNPKYRWDAEKLLSHPIFEKIKQPFPELVIFTNNVPVVQNIEKNRNDIFGWIKNVCVESKVSVETMCSSFQIIDLYAQKKKVSEKQLKIMACSSMLLSSKIFEVIILDVKYLAELTGGTVSEEDIITYEKIIMKILDGNLLQPTLFSYVSHIKKIEVDENTFKILLEQYSKPDIYSEPFSVKAEKILHLFQ